MDTTRFIEQFPQIASVLEGADHIDVKTVQGQVTLREFLAAMFNYQPGWVTILYGVRAVFVRFLGMKQKGIPRPPKLKSEDVGMIPGTKAAFFTVKMAQEDSYYVAEISESHLKAALGVVMEPLPNNLNRFHVITIVHYNRWTGPVYFNVIRPFHHLVVGGMARAGVKKR